ncbi:hypothetical protein ALP85_200044 [Pseudomonas syringae pv. syringae]|nr:hypothetical protein ALP85_200044 [Pseudomonas syringae pv. syringae]
MSLNTRPEPIPETGFGSLVSDGGACVQTSYAAIVNLLYEQLVIFICNLVIVAVNHIQHLSKTAS